MFSEAQENPSILALFFALLCSGYLFYRSTHCRCVAVCFARFGLFGKERLCGNKDLY
ncbi:hypothetical protein D049_2749 [Vibrio parahaemolyticus VPTS-2010]|nr:hypothetical protein D049_2749 [Vibrio parahaemolyticus VPTS-2010]